MGAQPLRAVEAERIARLAAAARAEVLMTPPSSRWVRLGQAGIADNSDARALLLPATRSSLFSQPSRFRTCTRVWPGLGGGWWATSPKRVGRPRSRACANVLFLKRTQRLVVAQSRRAARDGARVGNNNPLRKRLQNGELTIDAAYDGIGTRKYFFSALRWAATPPEYLLNFAISCLF